ncbi:MAG TPA: response regulator transcription factor [Planctomycetota bacterium]|nr:response regulator transcription factor [Planctomycetota bacterium]
MQTVADSRGAGNRRREKILVIEDEADILELIDYNLRREGYRVVGSLDGEQGLHLARKEDPDLVILDLMLPGMDGIEVCRELKRDPLTRAIPILMLTAKAEETDVVLGLGVGADDYVTKPFRPRELVARVQAVLRRGPLRGDGTAPARVVRGDLVIDTARHEVRVRDAVVAFTPTELRLLHLLASHPGRVFTRGHLLSRVIGEDAVVTDRNVDVHVRAVRQKLGDLRDLIETVRGVGYRFKDTIRVG